MPADIRDPEGWMPWHHDNLYKPHSGPVPYSPDMDSYLQGICEQELGIRLNGNDLERLRNHLDGKGFLHRHWGDESFRNEVCRFVKNLQLARKVAKKWLT